MTHLNDISKIYLEKIAEKKDDSYLETDMKKRQKNNEKAIADMKKVKDDTVPRWMKEGKKLDPVGQEDADIDNDGDVDKSDKYLHKKRKAIGKAISKKKGEDEEEVEESVVVTKKTLGSRFKNEAERQTYLKKLNQKSKEKKLNKLRATVEEVEEVEEVELDEKIDVRKQSSKRKSLGRGSSINPDAKKTGYESPAEFRKTEKKLAPYMEAKNVHGEVEVPSGDIKKLTKKASKRIDYDVDGDVDHNDPKAGPIGEFVPSADGKKRVYSGVKESFSNWREDLIEVVGEEGEKQIKEMPKNKKNTITINPKLGEAVEEMGGTLIEMIELDEMDVLIESVYEELIEEGYSEEDVEEAIEYSLIEAKVTYGHDTPTKKGEMMKRAKGHLRYLGRKTKEKFGSAKKKVGMASAQAQVAGYNKLRDIAQTAGDTKRRATKAVTDVPKKAKKKGKSLLRRAAQKVVDRMSEEAVDEAMRPGPLQRKMAAKVHDPYVRGGSKSRGQAHNIAVRGDVSTGDPAIKSRGGGGVKKDKGMGYGDRGAGNKARRRAGQEPLRGTVRKEEH